jgi:hypothetical protein
MKVKDLITKLEEFDGELEVFTETMYEGYFSEVTEVVGAETYPYRGADVRRAVWITTGDE